ncbi:hypothetical protein [Streptomyces sp. NPDC048650]
MRTDSAQAYAWEAKPQGRRIARITPNVLTQRLRRLSEVTVSSARTPQ